MPLRISNLESAEYGDVPFTPYTPKRRASFAIKDDDSDNAYDYLKREPAKFPMAMVGGIVGALLGAVIYALFVGFTGWTIGYLSILVGFLVGKGMMIGSQDEGSEGYQCAAVVLTYLSVATAHAGLLYWFSERNRPVPFDAHMALDLLKYGMMFPVLEILAYPAHGVIGLVILFVGIRAAWRMTSSAPGERSPFKR